MIFNKKLPFIVVCLEKDSIPHEYQVINMKNINEGSSAIYRNDWGKKQEILIPSWRLNAIGKKEPFDYGVKVNRITYYGKIAGNDSACLLEFLGYVKNRWYVGQPIYKECPGEDHSQFVVDDVIARHTSYMTGKKEFPIMAVVIVVAVLFVAFIGYQIYNKTKAKPSSGGINVVTTSVTK